MESSFLATSPSREAKENNIFFVAQSSTLLSSGLAEARRAFGASRRPGAHPVYDL